MSVVVVVCATLFFGVLNSSGVTVILPAMGAAFSADAAQLSWVMSGYLLTYGVAIPFYGKLADRIGARPLFLLGIVLFSAGSVACLAAPSFAALLTARVVQALGGAAFPGLGMAIVSRAFPVEKRGVVLGTISATIGIGSAVGPLVAGVLADLVHWRAMFGMSALAILVVPLAWRALARNDVRSDRPMDLIGGGLMALGITGLLFAVSESSKAGWTNPIVLLALSVGLLALAGLVIRQRTSHDPFIPKELVNNTRYLRLIALAFLVAAVNLAALIGFPLMLSTYNELDTLEIGLVMLPGAIATAVCGVLAGRLTDRVGPRLPTRLGFGVMLCTMISLSFLAGGAVLPMAILGGLLGAGFALLNTPIAAIVSVMVPPAMLASALSINTMTFFIGGSLGAALLSSIVTAHAGALVAWNPLYSGSAVGYSDAFAVLAFAMALALPLVAPLPTKEMVEAEKGHIQNAEN